VAKAKAVKPWVESLVTLGKRGTVAARRLAQKRLYTEQAGKRLFDELAPRFATRPGGYTRIQRAGFRKGDGAEVCYLEWVDYHDQKADAGGA
jgi:large subunit ribosomal protein L17